MPFLISGFFLNPGLFAWDYKGVCYDADWEDRSAWYGTAKSEEQLRRLKKMGVNAISVTSFAYQKDVNKPEITFRSALDEALIRDIQLAKKLGFFVVFKPHIWSDQFWDGSGHWHGTIAMKDKKGWSAWFSYYEKMICHFAVQAQKLNADAFVIGVEYVQATKNQRGAWNKIIKSIRTVYKGPLTYASHGLEEAEKIDFWEGLDFLGMNAYFPLAATSEPTLAELKEAWEKYSVRMKNFVRRRGGKKLLITEVGYSSADGTAMRPFRWPAATDPVDEEEQALSYEALLSTLKSADWLKGLFIWKFKVGVTAPPKSREASEAYFVFQDKLAEKVIMKHFLAVSGE